MEININWHQPIPLIDGSHDDLILSIEYIEDVYDGAGVYMFCRIYNHNLQPLYIGQSINIQKRIKQHLNSVRMMKGIQNAPRGAKVLVVGEFLAKPNQQIGKAIDIVETSLIEHALLNNFILLNESGTKRPTHKINFSDYSLAKDFSAPYHIVNA